MNQLIIQQIEDILNELRPAILSDGGDIEFVSFDDGKVFVKLHGACVQCPMSVFTLKLGIEERLKKAIPTITQVVSI